MALESGPTTLSTTLSTDACIANLTRVNRLCQVKMTYHQDKLNTFKSTCKILDIREIVDRYTDTHPDRSLESLTHSAHFYYLTVQGSMMALLVGSQQLLAHLNSCKKELLNQEFSSIKNSTFVLANTKLNLEQLALDFSRKNPKPEKGSPLEHHKNAMYEYIKNLTNEIALLTQVERLAIEYFEVTLKADRVFTELDNYEHELAKLTIYLSSLTPRDATTKKPPKSWDCFIIDDNINCDTLAAQLGKKLTLASSSGSDDDPSRWEGFPSRSPSPLNVPPTSSATVLTLYQTLAPIPAAAITPTATPTVSTPSSLVEDAKTRFDL